MPPLAGVAVKITEVPGQIVVDDAAIATEGITTAEMVMVILLEVAVAGDAQAALDVRITFTMSPFVNAAVVYVAAFVPALRPFTCH